MSISGSEGPKRTEMIASNPPAVEQQAPPAIGKMNGRLFTEMKRIATGAASAIMGSYAVKSLTEAIKSAKPSNSEAPSLINRAKQFLGEKINQVAGKIKTLFSALPGFKKDPYANLSPKQVKEKLQDELGTAWKDKYNLVMADRRKNVNEAWEKKYGKSDGTEVKEGKVRFNEDVKKTTYSKHDGEKGEITTEKLREGRVQGAADYEPGYLEVNFIDLAKMEKPGLSRLEQAFIQLVEPSAAKRAAKTFIAVQGARVFFHECLSKITDKVQKGEIKPEDGISKLRDMWLEKVETKKLMTKEEFKSEVFDEGGQAYTHGTNWKEFVQNTWADGESKEVILYAYPAANQHIQEAKYYLFGNDPARFEKDKGAYPNKNDYTQFQQALLNHFKAEGP